VSCTQVSWRSSRSAILAPHSSSLLSHSGRRWRVCPDYPAVMEMVNRWICNACIRNTGIFGDLLQFGLHRSNCLADLNVAPMKVGLGQWLIFICHWQKPTTFDSSSFTRSCVVWLVDLWRKRPQDKRWVLYSVKIHMFIVRKSERREVWGPNELKWQNWKYAKNANGNCKAN